MKRFVSFLRMNFSWFLGVSALICLGWLLQVFLPPQPRAVIHPVGDFAKFDPETGRFFFFSSRNEIADDGVFTVWDTKEHRLNLIIKEVPFGKPCFLAPDGSTLLTSAGFDIPAKSPESPVLWDLATGVNRNLPSDISNWSVHAFSPDGQTLAILNRRRDSKVDTVDVYDVATGKLDASLTATDFGRKVFDWGIYLSFAPNSRRPDLYCHGECGFKEFTPRWGSDSSKNGRISVKYDREGQPPADSLLISWLGMWFPALAKKTNSIKIHDNVSGGNQFICTTDLWACELSADGCTLVTRHPSKPQIRFWDIPLAPPKSWVFGPPLALAAIILGIRLWSKCRCNNPSVQPSPSPADGVHGA